MDITINSPKTGTPNAEDPTKIDPRQATVSYNFGMDDISEQDQKDNPTEAGKKALANAIEMFGADVVYSKFEAQCSTDLGNSCRRILNEPENSEQACLDFAAKYKPGVVTKGGGRKKAKTIPELVAELKNPETTAERKIAVTDLLKAAVAERKEAEAALKAVA